MLELISPLSGVISWAYWPTVTPLEGARVVKTSSGRHFGIAETDLFSIGMRNRTTPPPPSYFCRIFIELSKSILKSTFYQKVLAEFGPQNWYPPNFALDSWRHLLRYEPSLWGRGRPARGLCRRKVWEQI